MFKIILILFLNFIHKILMFFFLKKKAFIEFTKRLDQLEIRIDTETMQRLWNALTLNTCQSAINNLIFCF